jgi:hypothetical protein
MQMRADSTDSAAFAQLVKQWTTVARSLSGSDFDCARMHYVRQASCTGASLEMHAQARAFLDEDRRRWLEGRR